MAALSSFASELLEDSKRFLEKATEAKGAAEKNAFLHAALMVGFAAFEAHLNAMADDFLSRPDLSPHERGLLSERTVELIDGEFKEKDLLKMQRIEDRVLFLCSRFSKTPIDRSASYWSEFKEASRLRNHLTHPKADSPKIGESAVKRAIAAIIELLNTMCLALYKKKLPAYKRGLRSTLSF